VVPSLEADVAGQSAAAGIQLLGLDADAQVEQDERDELWCSKPCPSAAALSEWRR
jgi:hypothetical protein